MKEQPPSRDDRFLFTRREVAEVFAVGEPDVHGWVRKGCPTTRRRRGAAQLLDLREVRRWCDDRAPEERAERTRLDQLRAEKLELEIRKTRGDLVDGKAMAAVMGRYLFACRARLEGLHVQLTGRIGRALKIKDSKRLGSIERELKEGVNDALAELARAKVSDLVKVGARER